MKVFVTGADGFIGRHLVTALQAAGHEVIAAVRRPGRLQRLFPGLAFHQVDFTKDHAVRDWAPRLDGVDAVVNAVGIFSQRGTQTFRALHEQAPQALFAAALEAGVSRVVQISALGADAEASTGYHLSKAAADDSLSRLALCWVVVQPSLVYGPGGTSARLFNALATLPVIPLPGRGDQSVQPVHVDDLCAAIAALLQPGAPCRQRLALVGPAPVSLRDLLASLRASLGLRGARFAPVPLPVVRMVARLAEHVPGSLLSRDALAMLQRGSCADPAATRSLLGRPPRPVQAFVPAWAAPAERRAAQLAWLLPLLRLSVAFVWIAAGVVSLGLYPLAESYALLARVGLSGAAATGALFGAAVLDLALGIATLTLRRRRRLWQAQIALILTYSVIITAWLPEFWLHPFGPVVKNVPLLAVLVLLLVLEGNEHWGRGE